MIDLRSDTKTKPTQGTDNFGLDAKKGQYEDLDAFLNRADELALSLLEQGIDAMKIWPLDYAAEASSLSTQMSDAAANGIDVVRQTAEAVASASASKATAASPGSDDPSSNTAPESPIDTRFVSSNGRGVRTRSCRCPSWPASVAVIVTSAGRRFSSDTA